MNVFFMLLLCITPLPGSLGKFKHMDGYSNLRRSIEAAGGRSEYTSDTLWIEQKLDHFDTNEKRTWNMRYFQSVDYWQTNGPLYIFIGGEGPSSPEYFEYGLLPDLAKETNGAMFVTEHRYYGESMPVPVDTTDDYKYLSSRQALADLAHFITELKAKHAYRNSKVVVIGGSYAGNLAAWFKKLYPDLADATLASSAPVLAKLDFFEYKDTVSKDYEKYGPPGCYDAISRFFQQIEDSFKTQEGIEKLKKQFNICEDSDLNRSENKQLFFEKVTYPYDYNAQYGDIMSISTQCRSIMNLTSMESVNISTFYSWSEWTRIYYEEQNNCDDVNIDNTRVGMKQEEISWIYQTCTEFGYYQTTSTDKPFTNNIHLEVYSTLCSVLFGSRFNEASIGKAVNETNKFYGGLELNVTKVLFTNGELDPWHRLGITKDLSEEAPVIFIPKASHCKDLHADKPNDHIELTNARQVIKKTLKQWIGFDS